MASGNGGDGDCAAVCCIQAIAALPQSVGFVVVAEAIFLVALGRPLFATAVSAKQKRQLACSKKISILIQLQQMLLQLQQ